MEEIQQLHREIREYKDIISEQEDMLKDLREELQFYKNLIRDIKEVVER